MFSELWLDNKPPPACQVLFFAFLKSSAIGHLRAANQDPNQEHQRAPQAHLQDGGRQGGIHEPVPDPGNNPQFHAHHTQGQRRGGVNIRYQERQCMEQAPGRRHAAAHRAARPRMPASGQNPIVGQGFGEAHADARAQAGGQSDQESRPAMVRGISGGKDRGQG